MTLKNKHGTKQSRRFLNMNENVGKFRILISSDCDYEELVIFLMFGNARFAILNCDEGLSQTKIEIQARTDSKAIWEFNYHEYIKALTMAYEKLKETNQHVISK